MNTIVTKLPTDVNNAIVPHMENKTRKRVNLYLPVEDGETLMSEARHRAVDEKTSLNDLMFRALREYLKKHKQAQEKKR